MFKPFMAASLAALSLLASPAAAQDPARITDNFRKLCADRQGDGAAALEMGRAAGWAQIPSQMFEGADNPFTSVTALMNAEQDDSLSVLLVGDMEQKFETVPVKMGVCAVMSMKPGSDGAGPKALVPMVGSWVGVDPHPDFTRDGMTGYAFTVDETGARTGLRSQAAGMQAALTGGLHVVMVGGEDEMSMVMYARPIIANID